MEKTGAVEVRGVRIGEGIPKICVPIVEKSREAILAAAERVKEAGPDIVEWRADWFEEVTDEDAVTEVLSDLRGVLGSLPILFTFRTAAEGGAAEIGEEAYLRLNTAAAGSGNADLLDVELFSGDAAVRTLLETAHAHHVRVVASSHDFRRTPEKEELIRRMRKMDALGADILKIAVMPQSAEDVLTLLAATSEMRELYTEKPLITMSMSGTGLISRLSGETFGSAVTFGSAGKASAPGQMDAGDLKTVLHLIHGSICSGQSEKISRPADKDAAEYDGNVFLIGFMGSGKSTVASGMEKMFGMKRLEMDQVIEKEQGMTIAQIFAERGEEYFRNLETELTERLQEDHRTIISCGGGVPMREQNVRNMRKSGKIVLLTARPETILARVGHSKNRPILNGHMNLEYISGLMEERRGRYEAAADITVATDGKSISDICREIAEKLREAD